MSLCFWFWRKPLSSHPFNTLSAISLLYRFFIILRYVPSIPHVSRTYHESLLNLFSAFSASVVMIA